LPRLRRLLIACSRIRIVRIAVLSLPSISHLYACGMDYFTVVVNRFVVIVGIQWTITDRAVCPFNIVAHCVS
jgi:hypothetical protein